MTSVNRITRWRRVLDAAMRGHHSFRVLLAALLLAGALAAPAQAARFAAIATGDERVALADVDGSRIVSLLPVNGRTRAVAAAPDGTHAYVGAGDGVWSLDFATQALTGPVMLSGPVASLAVAPDGSAVYAARGRSLTILSGSPLAATGTIALGRYAARRIAIAPDGRRAIVVLAKSRFAVVDLPSGQVVRTIKARGAVAAAFGRSPVRGFVSTSRGRLVVVDVSAAAVIGSLITGAGGGVAISPRGNQALIGSVGKRTRRGALVDLLRGKVIARPKTGRGPGEPAFNPSGTRAYVADSRDGTVSVLSASTGRRLGTLRLPGTRPVGIAIQPGLAQTLGSEGPDIIKGTRGPDLLQGFGGDDQLRGGRGNDVIIADAGNDLLVGGQGNDRLDGGDGDDRLLGQVGRDHLFAGAGNDTMDGGTAGDTLDGGDGDDLIDGGDGDDTITGGPGDDSIVEKGLGNDKLLDGGPGNDLIDGNRGNDRKLNGGEGDDRLYGRNGSDLLDGGPGNDLLEAGRGADRAFGRDGDDVLTGDAGDDYLSGSAGNDQVDGGSGDDNLAGSDGEDTIVGGGGLDIIKSGPGNDTVRAADDSADQVDCGDGFDRLYTENTDPSRDARVNCEVVLMVPPEPSNDGPEPSKLSGTSGPDTIYGTPEDDSIFGSGGNDVLWGQEGDDYVDGETGDDELHGGPGNDRMPGRRGNDTILGNEGDDHLTGEEGNDFILGGPGNDRIYGNFGADRIDGGEGDDRINTLDDTQDKVRCGPGNDVVFADPEDRVEDDCEDIRR